MKTLVMAAGWSRALRSPVRVSDDLNLNGDGKDDVLLFW